jgi:hypothetical protein
MKKILAAMSFAWLAGCAAETTTGSQNGEVRSACITTTDCHPSLVCATTSVLGPHCGIRCFSNAQCPTGEVCHKECPSDDPTTSSSSPATDPGPGLCEPGSIESQVCP